MRNETNPKTLQEAIIYFSKPEHCLNYLVARRWPNGVICPTCGRNDVTYLAKQKKWQCKSAHTRRQFSVKIGTIFEDSPLSLDKWLLTVWLITNAKNGISSYEVSRAIGVTQKTAWFMVYRIRLAKHTGTFETRMNGEIEVDETFIGGKARNMPKNVKARRVTGRGSHASGKVAVMGLLERHGEVGTQIAPNVRRKSLHTEVMNHVERGATVYTERS